LVSRATAFDEKLVGAAAIATLPRINNRLFACPSCRTHPECATRSAGHARGAEGGEAARGQNEI